MFCCLRRRTTVLRLWSTLTWNCHVRSNAAIALALEWRELLPVIHSCENISSTLLASWNVQRLDCARDIHFSTRTDRRSLDYCACRLRASDGMDNLSSDTRISPEFSAKTNDKRPCLLRRPMTVTIPTVITK